MKVPCKGCDSRQVGCHCKCEGYKEFCKERDAAAKERMRDKRSRDAYYDGFQTLHKHVGQSKNPALRMHKKR